MMTTTSVTTLTRNQRLYPGIPYAGLSYWSYKSTYFLLLYCFARFRRFLLPMARDPLWREVASALSCWIMLSSIYSEESSSDCFRLLSCLFFGFCLFWRRHSSLGRYFAPEGISDGWSLPPFCSSAKQLLELPSYVCSYSDSFNSPWAFFFFIYLLSC